VQGLRLLELTLARARREQLLREVSTQVNNAIDTDHILRQAAEQVGRVLKRPVYVYLNGQSGEVSNDEAYTKAGEDGLDEFIR
jgi:K+-sensing histidine kinase KdpD